MPDYFTMQNNPLYLFSSILPKLCQSGGTDLSFGTEAPAINTNANLMNLSNTNPTMDSSYGINSIKSTQNETDASIYSQFLMSMNALTQYHSQYPFPPQKNLPNPFDNAYNFIPNETQCLTAPSVSTGLMKNSETQKEHKTPRELAVKSLQKEEYVCPLCHKHLPTEKDMEDHFTEEMNQLQSFFKELESTAKVSNDSFSSMNLSTSSSGVNRGPSNDQFSPISYSSLKFPKTTQQMFRAGQYNLVRRNRINRLSSPFKDLLANDPSCGSSSKRRKQNGQQNHQQ